MLDKWHKKEKPVFTGITRGIGGFGLGSAGLSYWIATLGGTSFETSGAIAIDNSGNVYIAGNTESDGAGDSDIVIAKYNSSGTIQWQRTLGGTSEYDYGRGIAIDNSGDVYIVGRAFSDDAGDFFDILIAKYNSSGTIQWQRTLGLPPGGVSTAFDTGAGIAVDNSDNVYIVGRTDLGGAGNRDILIAKYNSSGTIQWQRNLGGTSNDVGYEIAVDNSGNVYIVGQTSSDGAGGADTLIAKYNSSGTIQWQRTLGGTSEYDYGRGIAIDNSGDVYIVGRAFSDDAGDFFDILIAKYNSSGTIQWQRTLDGVSDETGQGIAIDNSDNVYIVGQTSSDGAGGSDNWIAKYNTSGDIQWQRTLGGTDTDSGFGIAVDNSDNVYIVGRTRSDGAGDYDIVIAKLPGDGSRTGIYGAFTYTSSSLTDSASSLTSSVSTLTSSVSTLTDSASNLTDAASDLTSSFIPLV